MTMKKQLNASVYFVFIALYLAFLLVSIVIHKY